MTILKQSLKLTLCLLPLALSACGDGWQVVYTKDVFPYGNERTAGSGVIYVREIIMPAKDMKLEPVSEIVKADERVAEGLKMPHMNNDRAGDLVLPLKNRLEEIFRQKQSK